MPTFNNSASLHTIVGTGCCERRHDFGTRGLVEKSRDLCSRKIRLPLPAPSCGTLISRAQWMNCAAKKRKEHFPPSFSFLCLPNSSHVYANKHFHPNLLSRTLSSLLHHHNTSTNTAQINKQNHTKQLKMPNLDIATNKKIGLALACRKAVQSHTHTPMAYVS